MISDEVIDKMIGTGPVSSDQAKKWCKTVRRLCQTTFEYYQRETSDLRTRVNELTNEGYEKRIEELQDEMVKMDDERADWMYKYLNLSEKVDEFVSQIASDKQTLSE